MTLYGKFNLGKFLSIEGAYRVILLHLPKCGFILDWDRRGMTPWLFSTERVPGRNWLTIHAWGVQFHAFTRRDWTVA